MLYDYFFEIISHAGSQDTCNSC